MITFIFWVTFRRSSELWRDTQPKWLLIAILLRAFLLVCIYSYFWFNFYWKCSFSEMCRWISSIGACNMFISHPLDTIKTNMQSENMRFVQATRNLFKNEGVNLPKKKCDVMNFFVKFKFFCCCCLFCRQNPIIEAFYFRCVQQDF